MAIRTHIAKQEEGEVESAVQVRSSDPVSPADNQLWINTSSGELKLFDGTDTIAIGGDGLQDHIDDPTAAHAASAISNTPSGNLAATTVQAALNELQSDIDTRLTQDDLDDEIADREDADNDLYELIGEKLATEDFNNHVDDDTNVHGIVSTSDLMLSSAPYAGTPIVFDEMPSPAAPGPNQVLLYPKANGKFYKKADDGVEELLGAGGGGGGALQWVEALDSPDSTVDYNMRVYKFADAITQALYALICVPSGYSAGSPIKLKITPYSKDTSSTTMLIQSVATLIRTGTDAFSSTTNQRTSTNTAVSIGASTVDRPQAVVLDLTSTSGQINSVNVSAGDQILVKLTRDYANDTSTQDVYVPVYGAEVTFT